MANTNNKIYDLVIIGAGPAGLMASIYASRYKLTNLVVGKQLGGELSWAAKVENCPGFVSITGLELAGKIAEQAEYLGAKILHKEAGKIEQMANSKERMDNAKFKILINDNEFYLAKTLIVATGSERRKLNVPGEQEFVGKGVSYCTTCDAPFYKNKTVALIGGSDSTCSGAIHLSEYAKKVYIIYRKDKLRAEPSWVEDWEKLVAEGKGETIYNTNVMQILGKQELTKLQIQNEKLKIEVTNSKLGEKSQLSVGDVVGGIRLDNPYKGSDMLEVDGVFVEIGGVPGTALVKPLGVELDETGHVKVTDEMSTSIAGLFCAGDMTSKSADFKQAISAMAQGARAGASAYKYLKGQQAPQIKGN